MDVRNGFPIESVFAVHSVGKDWPRTGQHALPYVRRQKHRSGGERGDQPAEEPDREDQKKESARDGTTTRDHPDSFEVVV